MTKAEATPLIDLFGEHRRIGLLQFESAQSSVTLRRAPVSPAPAGPAPAGGPVGSTAVEVMAPAVGMVHLESPDGLDLAAQVSIGEGEEIGWIQTASRRTPILAPVSGVVVAVDVTAGQFVEYGQGLVRLMAAGDAESGS